MTLSLIRRTSIGFPLILIRVLTILPSSLKVNKGRTIALLIRVSLVIETVLGGRIGILDFNLPLGISLRRTLPLITLPIALPAFLRSKGVRSYVSFLPLFAPIALI